MNWKRPTEWTTGAKLVAGVIAVTWSISVLMLVFRFVQPPQPAAPQPEFVERFEPTEPPRNLMGWAGQDKAKEEWQRIRHLFPKFGIRGAQKDNAKRRVALWDASKLVTGDSIPNFRQLIGDCVGAGAKHAVDYLQCSAIVQGAWHQFRPVYEPYHYATGRNAPECGNGRIRGPDGSLGSWQARALQLYGVIPADLPGLEPYSESVIRRWAVRMPEKRWIDVGKMHLVRTAAMVTTAEEVRDAVCNGYPVTIASNWGGLMRPPVKNGKLVNRRSGTWAHQMCIIAYDGTGDEPLWYVLNSWGPHAHGDPPDDSPPGGFWIAKHDVDYIVRQEDTFALSAMEGFPANDWDIALEWHRAKAVVYGGCEYALAP